MKTAPHTLVPMLAQRIRIMSYSICISHTVHCTYKFQQRTYYNILLYSLALRRGLEHPLGSLASPLCRERRISEEIAVRFLGLGAWRQIPLWG